MRPITCLSFVLLPFMMLPGAILAQLPADQDCTCKDVGDGEFLCKCFPRRLPALGADVRSPMQDKETRMKLSERVKIGQTVAEVHALLGPPNRSTNSATREEWTVSTDGKLVFEVQYEKGAVQWMHRFTDQSSATDNQNPNSAPQQQNASTASKVENVAQGLMMTHYCPQVYRIPLLLMDTNAAQWLKACNENGFMLFGLYIYNPPH